MGRGLGRVLAGAAIGLVAGAAKGAIDYQLEDMKAKQQEQRDLRLAELDRNKADYTAALATKNAAAERERVGGVARDIESQVATNRKDAPYTDTLGDEASAGQGAIPGAKPLSPVEAAAERARLAAGRGEKGLAEEFRLQHGGLVAEEREKRAAATEERQAAHQRTTETRNARMDEHRVRNDEQHLGLIRESAERSRAAGERADRKAEDQQWDRVTDDLVKGFSKPGMMPGDKDIVDVAAQKAVREAMAKIRDDSPTVGASYAAQVTSEIVGRATALARQKVGTDESKYRKVVSDLTDAFVKQAIAGNGKGRVSPYENGV